MMRKWVTYSLFFLFGLSLAYLLTPLKRPNTPSTLYKNGHFITMEADLPIADAMWVSKGKIQAIGLEEQIVRDIDTDVAIVDLKGQTVLPGFVDPHTHFSLSLFLEGMIDLSGFRHRSNEEVWSHFEKEAVLKEPGEWIVAKGIDPILIPDLKMPDINYFDSIAPNNPVLILTQSLHNCWANSVAFAKAGVTSSTPRPSNASYYEKSEDGTLTGMIVEQDAMSPFFSLLRDEVLTLEYSIKAAERVMRSYAANGNTTIASTGLTITDEKPLLLLEHLSGSSSPLMARILSRIGIFPPTNQFLRHFIYLRHDMAQFLPADRGATDDFYEIIGIKHWYDGSPYIGSMYLNEPYLSSELTQDLLHIKEGSRGRPLIETDELKSFIRKHHNGGWQIAIHTQGDAAIAEVVNTYADLSEELDFEDRRHRLEHCLLLPQDQLTKMSQLGIVPSFHINHLLYYGDALKEGLLGEGRAELILPLRSTLNAGIPISLHADQPMFESDPFRLIQTAIERKTRRDSLIAKSESIDLTEALRALTIDAAWQIHKDNVIGSLKKGKYADFIILNQNPYEVPTDRLSEIEVVSTFVNGNRIEVNQ